MVDQNINQVELSRICSVSRSTVSKWMSGDSEPTKARRNEIAEAFHGDMQSGQVKISIDIS